METVLFVLLFALLGPLAMRYGTDSRAHGDWRGARD